MRRQHHPTAESPNVELRKWLQERTDAVECRSKSGVGRTALQRELAAGGAGARAQGAGPLGVTRSKRVACLVGPGMRGTCGRTARARLHVRRGVGKLNL